MSRPSFSLAANKIRTLGPIQVIGGLAVSVTGGITGAAKFTMPCKGQIVGLTLNYQAKGGTHVNTSLNVLAGASSLLAVPGTGGPFDIDANAAATPLQAEGAALSAAAASVAKDTTIAVDIAEAGGTSPTLSLVTVQVDFVPLGD